jgi:hypothetical protein
MNDKVSFAFVDGCLVVKVDLNKDGQPFLELKIELAEIPEEIFSLISAKKAAVAA